MSKKLFSTSLLMALLLGRLFSAFGQSTTASQDFEGANTAGSLSFTVSGGQYFTGNSGSAFAGPNPSPNNSSVSTSGTRSYGAQNNTGSGIVATTMDFRNVSFTNFSNNSINFRLAVFATNQNGGLASNGSVIVSVSTNGGSSYNTALTIVGNGNGRDVIWDFSATATATATVGAGAPTYTAGTTSATRYSFIQLALPATVTQAKVRIVANANDKTAIVIDDVVISSAGPLPVTLTHFSAERQGSSVAVSWATATEKDNAYFEILRSADGKSFDALGRVKGRGTTTASTTYAFTDYTAPAGLSYYQLRQVDADGTASLSSVIVVVATDELAATFYPNPSNSSITLPAVGGVVEYRVHSVTGQVLVSGKGSGNTTVAVEAIPAGIYFLELTAGGKRNVQRFVRH
ncbi:T9SS type A sorting domain-containing protein [Hymenobacter metallilatus]|uniref:T9SS C-terminal target domain-containing protein n=1 Tax=Hymenobacter metallilatus TaxID=2493666 RepID=A0A428JQ70_9BACT|nr:T9SS type A sorting domain-containing protein [Hymenobacter metallilatus]RSK35446.1 T9SS C-terminal target domain-containing protein [Hymenobacter metallilatus]